MKNLNKALAVLVVITMMISSVAFAATFSDVADDAAYGEAVNVGVALNLFKGYEDGTFKPEGDITRAEFAAIVVRMMGQEAQAAGAAGATAFTDVAADHWASGYINIATRLGIINGYGDGKFGPEDKVLYEQTIKMVVVAIGYEPAIGSAGYPVGYLTKAGELGVTSGVAGSNGVAANRGLVAQIVLNTLDVPLMQQTGYGTFVDYVIQDGYGDTTRKTMLSEYLSVVKLQVLVNTSSLLDSGNKKTETVTVEILNNYKTKYYDEFQDGRYGSNSSDKTYKIAVGNTALSSMVGSKAIVYVLYDDNSSDEPVAVYAAKDTTKTYEVTISTDSLEKAEVVAGELVLDYYANATDRKPEKVSIKLGGGTANVKNLYVNGGTPEALTLASQLMTGAASDMTAVHYGEITLAKLNSNNSEDYDTVYVTDYKNVVVDNVNKNTSRVTPKNYGPTIVFDPDDSSITANLYDDKGAKMEWTDLKEWDVLSVQIAEGTSGKEVYNAKLVKNSITGKITGVKDAGDDAKVKFEIGGTDYQIDPVGMSEDELYLGDEGTFYLDLLGRITWYDTTTASNSNYAFIQNIVNVEGLTSQPEMKIFTASGDFQTLRIASTVKIDGVSGLKSKEMTFVDGVGADITKAMSETEVDKISDRDGGGHIRFVSPNVVVDGISKGDFITFKTNSSNEVTEIDRAATGLSMSDVRGKFTNYGSQETTEYTEASQSFDADAGRIYLTDKTVIMIAPEVKNTAGAWVISDDDDDYGLFTIASIDDEQKFAEVTFFNVDQDKNVGAILVKREVSIATGSGFLALSGYSATSNSSGDSNFTLKGFKDGIAETGLITTTDFDEDTAASGTIALPVKNSKGEIKALDVLASLDDISNPTSIDIGAKLKASNAASITLDKAKYFTGKVREIRNRNITLVAPELNLNINNSKATIDAANVAYKATNATAGFDISAAGANVYVYDARLTSSRRLQVSDVSYIEAKIATSRDAGYVDGQTYYADRGGDIASVYAVAREYDGKIVDVILYIFDVEEDIED